MHLLEGWKEGVADSVSRTNFSKKSLFICTLNSISCMTISRWKTSNLMLPLTFYKIYALFTNFELNLVSSLKNFATLLLVLLDMLLTLGDGTEQGKEVIKPLKMFLPKDKPQHNSLLY